ncbi:outer membrane beta-barrel protein [Tenacibaculum dicentrarchi]|uniref:outer membrane beta-barrel protein n=1 Tax=Tenacibaculum dicentrarchi TaxID=669041 RepID=UPI000C7BF4FB|nr:conserved exported hypothetical protein [Tenacibaculum dicentrarchi]
MKKVLLTIAIVAAGFTANAQNKNEVKGGFTQEDIYVSGSVGYSKMSGAGDVSIYTFSPSVGYFVSENIALELGLAISGSENGAAESTAFGVKAGADYFFTPKNNFSFVVGAGLGYTTYKTETAGIEGPDRNTFSLDVSPGINYFVSNSIALKASVGALSYNSSKVDITGAKSVNSFGLNLNLSNVNFGLTYKF